MTISAPLRPGTPNGLAAGPLRNETMPSRTGPGGCRGAGACAAATATAATVTMAASAATRGGFPKRSVIRLLLPDRRPLCDLLVWLKETRSRSHIQLVFVAPPDDKMSRAHAAEATPERHDVIHHTRPQHAGDPEDRPRSQADDPTGRVRRTDLAAGGAGRGSRYPHRSVALPGLARRADRRRAGRRHALVARGSRRLRDRLLVLLRGGAHRRSEEHTSELQSP